MAALDYMDLFTIISTGMVNRTIRNFAIKELIATGGMAAIYKAVQVSLERVVAIKILHGHLAQDKDFITRFEREAKAAANLQHENIVNIIDYGREEDIYFIAMEFVEGKSLKELISSVKFVPQDTALAITREIGRGLGYAHQRGVVHRDIKPANILIGHDGTVKIADFGLAQAQDLTSITITGSIVGTPAYMSPEQAGGKKIDARSDIFSLGVVVYELITGIKPFGGENYSSVIHSILTVIPPKPTDANPLISKDIGLVIEKMLEKEPDRRYQTVEEMTGEVTAYFRKCKCEIGRKEIGAFISAPAEQFKNLVQKRKEKHYERALYYMSLGNEKIDDAIGEFEKVLRLDPDDSRVKNYLSELKAKKEKTASSVVKRQAAKPRGEKKVPQKRGIPVPLAVVGGVVLLAILLFAIYNLVPRRKTPTLAPSVIPGMVQVNSVPDSAWITLDNNELKRRTPAVLDSLAVGFHTIALKKEGYKPYTQDFEVKNNNTIIVNAMLNKETEAAKYGKAVITSTPTGAAVFIDGKNAGEKTPCTITSIETGTHKFRLTKQNFQATEVTRNVTDQKPLEISITLIAEKPSPAGVSYLKINVEPWAKIYIDNKHVETTPIARNIEVTSGAHTVKLENPSYKIWQKDVQFKPGETVSLDVKLDKLEGHLKLTVKPWADVYIDGRFYETTPIDEPVRLTAGKHALKLINPSYQVYEEPIEIQAGKMLKKSVELRPK